MPASQEMEYINQSQELFTDHQKEVFSQVITSFSNLRLIGELGEGEEWGYRLSLFERRNQHACWLKHRMVRSQEELMQMPMEKLQA